MKLTMTDRGEEYITIFKPAPITPTAPLRVSPSNANWVIIIIAVKITHFLITQAIIHSVYNTKLISNTTLLIQRW